MKNGKYSRKFNKYMRASWYTTDFKYGRLSNHLFQRKQEHGDWEEPQGNDKKLCSPVIKWNKNPFIKASCTNNIHAGETIFCNYYFWRFVSRFFSGRGKKLVMYFSLRASSFVFQRIENHINTACEKLIYVSISR